MPPRPRRRRAARAPSRDVARLARVSLDPRRARRYCGAPGGGDAGLPPRAPASRAPTRREGGLVGARRAGCRASSRGRAGAAHGCRPPGWTTNEGAAPTTGSLRGRASRLSPWYGGSSRAVGVVGGYSEGGSWAWSGAATPGVLGFVGVNRMAPPPTSTSRRRFRPVCEWRRRRDDRPPRPPAARRADRPRPGRRRRGAGHGWPTTRGGSWIGGCGGSVSVVYLYPKVKGTRGTSSRSQRSAARGDVAARSLELNIPGAGGVVAIVVAEHFLAGLDVFRRVQLEDLRGDKSRRAAAGERTPVRRRSARRGCTSRPPPASCRRDSPPCLG